jgi:hypothetical protein
VSGGASEGAEASAEARGHHAVLVAEVLVYLVLVSSLDLVDPSRLLAWCFGGLPELPWPDLRPWLSLAEGIRNLLLALVVAAIFFRGRVAEGVRYAVAGGLALLLCVVPALAQVELRTNVDEAPGNTAAFRSSTHDGGVLQVEMASEAILRGESPYGMRYGRPPVTRSRDSDPEGWRSLGYDHNPAFDHLAYPAGVLYVSVPPYWLGRRALGFYDQRLVHLAAALALALVLASLVSSGAARRTVVVATLANPLLVRFLAGGRNDVLVLLPLAVFGALLLDRRWLAASVALGCALATKQFAVFVVPFFLLAVHRASDRSLRETLRLAWPVAAVPLLVAAPFLVFDGRDYMNDVYLWVFGTGYPLRWNGYGLTPLAYGLGLVDRPSGPNPYGPLGIVLQLASLAGLTLWTWRSSNATRVLLASGALLYVALLASRSFALNYLAAPALLWVVAWLGSRRGAP